MNVSDETWARIVANQDAALKELGFDPEGADAAILSNDGEHGDIFSALERVAVDIEGDGLAAGNVGGVPRKVSAV